MSNELIIRAARIDDAPDIARLSGQLGYPSTPDATGQRLYLLIDHPEHDVLVAEQQGQVVGFLHVLVHQSLVHDKAAEIAALVIDEAHRGNGTGRFLMERAEQWAREHNCGSVRLRSNVVRSGAHQFYERLGYALWKSSHAFRKDLPTAPTAE